MYFVLCCAKDLFCNANEKNNPVFTWQGCWKSVLGMCGEVAAGQSPGGGIIVTFTQSQQECSLAPEGYRKGAWLFCATGHRT